MFSTLVAPEPSPRQGGYMYIFRGSRVPLKMTPDIAQPPQIWELGLAERGPLIFVKLQPIPTGPAELPRLFPAPESLDGSSPGRVAQTPTGHHSPGRTRGLTAQSLCVWCTSCPAAGWRLPGHGAARPSVPHGSTLSQVTQPVLAPLRW